MKTFNISKAKIISEILRMIVGIFVLQIIIDYIIDIKLFQNFTAIILSTSIFAIMMLLTWAALMCAAPTIIEIRFADDHLILKLIRGHEPKKVSYKDIYLTKKRTFAKNKMLIRIRDEKLPLLLQLFSKSDKDEILNTLVNKTKLI